MANDNRGSTINDQQSAVNGRLSAVNGRRAIFLDRDGVINRMVYNPEFGLVDSPANPDEFQLLPDAGEVVHQINQLGFLAIVISNQPGIAKGKFTPAILDAITEKMHRELSKAEGRLDSIYYCLHHPQAVLDKYRIECDCRKPKPGLLKQAAQEWDIDLEHSYFIGDGITDIAAGQSTGVRTLFVSSRKPYILDELFRHKVQPTYIVGSLVEAVQAIRAIESGDGERIEPFLFRGFLINRSAG